MDVTSLAASAVASTASQTRDGFQIAALKIANEQTELMAGLVANVADIAKAQNPVGVGGNVDQMA